MAIVAEKVILGHDHAACAVKKKISEKDRKQVFVTEAFSEQKKTTKKNKNKNKVRAIQSRQSGKFE